MVHYIHLARLRSHRIQRDEDITGAPRESRPQTVFLRAARKVNEDREAGLREREKLRRSTAMLGGSPPFFIVHLARHADPSSFFSSSSPLLFLGSLAFPRTRLPSARMDTRRFPISSNFPRVSPRSRVQDRTRVPISAKTSRLTRKIWRKSKIRRVTRAARRAQMPESSRNRYGFLSVLLLWDTFMLCCKYKSSLNINLFINLYWIYW